MNPKEFIIHIENHIPNRGYPLDNETDQEITGSITIQPDEEMTIPLEVDRIVLTFPRSDRRLWYALFIILCSQIGFAIFFLYTILFG